MLRIKDIRERQNLTQDEVSRRSGIPKRTYVNYENGLADVPISKLQNIATVLNSSVAELLDETAEDKIKTFAEAQTPYVVTVTSDNKDNIVMVPVSARAGYLSSYDDPQFISKLPSYSLPQIKNGIFRMFQVSGQSMIPTIHDKSFVVGQFVENWIDDIKDNRVYVIVSQDEGIVVKRCLNRIEKYGSLYCKSDNRQEFPSFSLEAGQILEVWEVKMLLSFELLDPATLFDRINDLEAELLRIKDLLK